MAFNWWTTQIQLNFADLMSARRVSAFEHISCLWCNLPEKEIPFNDFHYINGNEGSDSMNRIKQTCLRTYVICFCFLKTANRSYNYFYESSKQRFQRCKQTFLIWTIVARHHQKPQIELFTIENRGEAPKLM